MAWTVIIDDEFSQEVEALPKPVRLTLLARAELLAISGPGLGRPFVDTLKGSKFSNMKELRFDADNGIWRVAFAFDVKREAILLVAGDKAGTNQARFYKALIKRADQRFAKYVPTSKSTRR